MQPEPMMMLLREIPWSECRSSELLVSIPGIINRVDSDTETVRVYQVLRDIFAKVPKKKTKFGNGKMWIKKVEG